MNRTLTFPSPRLKIPSSAGWNRIGSQMKHLNGNGMTSPRLIKLLGDGADFAYLETAAESVGVSDLLRRLREQL